MTGEFPIVGIIGVGVMGEGVLGGLLAHGVPLGSVVASARRMDRAEQLHAQYGVRMLPDWQVAEVAEVLLLAVKPGDALGLLAGIRQYLTPKTVLVSLAAGVSLGQLEQAVPGVACVRLMPNTPLTIGVGMSVITPGNHCTPTQTAQVQGLFERLGQVAQVPERLQDAATAVSGCGPAYLFYLAEAMVDGGVLAGLPRPLASQLVQQTLLGAASMLADQHPTLLKEQVTSPGGATSSALQVLEAHGVRAALAQAIRSAQQRCAELAED